MSYEKIKARLKRNKLDELAGEFYRGNDSQIVKELKKRSKKALVGIQNAKGLYTILGEELVYYSMESGEEKEISIPNFLSVLGKNALATGKTGKFEFVNINDEDSVWVLDGPTMNAMWNTMLLLNDNIKQNKT